MGFTLSLGPEEKRFRRELRDFLGRELTDEIRRQHAMDKGVGPEARAFSLKLGATGWLGLGWPEKYGGSGGSIVHEYILVQEFARQEAFVPNIVARFMCGPIILRHGSEELKRDFLPRIARGEIEFGLGYTEPNAGSDLASMRMQAVEEGDFYVINGQKTFNTESHYADYHWLAARTDPHAPRHKAISLFIVDQNAPGITIRPIETLGGERTNEVFYDGVRVPKSRLVGQKNHGFYYMVEALEYERLMLFQNERLISPLKRLIAYTKQAERRGKRLSDIPSVRSGLSKIAVDIEVARCLEERAFSLLAEGEAPGVESGIVKLFGSELRQRFFYLAIDILGMWGRLTESDPCAPLKGEMERLCRMAVVDTIGGGTSEILRNVIALRGLGLPKSY